MTRIISLANRRKLALAAWSALTLAACDPPRRESAAIATTPVKEPEVVPAGGLPPSVPVAAEPVTRVATYEEAESVFRSGKYGEAKQLFATYATTRPENPWGHYMLGLAAWKSGDFVTAERAFDKALELDFTHVKSYLNSARLLLDLDRDHEALERVETALRLDSTSSDGLRLLARTHAKLGDVEAALGAYRKALVLDDKDVWAMNNLGVLYLDEGNPEAAVGPLARAVQLKGTAPLFENNLGMALEKTGHNVAAKRAYQAAIKADSTYAKAVKNLERLSALVSDEVTDDGVFVKEQAEVFRVQIQMWKDSVER